mmetsp:Transcript_78693/g.202695  ORF Transcript_78693/g.202695 Transcript_78693/m.202695 type:complete len:204 (-) Transcript_78693:164-775(-)
MTYFLCLCSCSTRASSQTLTSIMSWPGGGMKPQTSKFTTGVETRSAKSNQSRSFVARALFARSAPQYTAWRWPGYLRPQPRMPPRSLPVPSGIWTSAGKYLSISSSVQQKPFPRSRRPSTELSARSALKTRSRAKEAVPSPPPHIRRGRNLAALLTMASSFASFKRMRNISMTLSCLATSTMWKQQSLNFGVFAHTSRMGWPF